MKKIKWLLIIGAAILILVLGRNAVLPIVMGVIALLAGLFGRKYESRLHEIQTEEERHKKEVLEEAKALHKQQQQKVESLHDRAESLKKKVKRRRDPWGPLTVALLFLVLFAVPAQAGCEEDLNEALEIIEEYQLLVQEKDDIIEYLFDELEYWQANSGEKTEIIAELGKELKKKDPVRWALIGALGGLLLGILVQ